MIEMNGAGGTNFFTGTAFSLGQVDAALRIDGVLQRHSLGVRNINGFPFDQTLIVSIQNFFRAFCSALPAGNAFAHIHITGMLNDPDLKIPLFPTDSVNF
jgi:hypothetical protein